jgi:hypothetical protein
MTLVQSLEKIGNGKEEGLSFWEEGNYSHRKKSSLVMMSFLILYRNNRNYSNHHLMNKTKNRPMKVVYHYRMCRIYQNVRRNYYYLWKFGKFPDLC